MSIFEAFEYITFKKYISWVDWSVCSKMNNGQKKKEKRTNGEENIFEIFISLLHLRTTSKINLFIRWSICEEINK